MKMTLISRNYLSNVNKQYKPMSDMFILNFSEERKITLFPIIDLEVF